MAETHKRSVAKAISYRLLATLTTTMVVFAVTRKFGLALQVGLIDMIAKTTFYYVHERAWTKIKFGKAEHPLEALAVNKELAPEDLEKVKEQLKGMGYID